ncbi:MAG TPA: reverse transcriptase domain-containing protein [Candidatus Brocadiales bacterium]|nr:reverse transcriptase domain-containing protein [Candidatus Brocadiales bacterium]
MVNVLNIVSLNNKTYAQDDPVTYNDAVKGDRSDKWKEAMNAEIQSLIANNTWDVVRRNTTKGKVVKTKWVYKTKRHLDGTIDKYKARLVAKGYSQTQGIDVNETFASIVKHKTWRAMLAIAVELDLKVYHWDIATAFLNAKLDEEVYIETPTGYDFGQNVVLKLKKGLYGLQQASRQWLLDLTATLKNLGLERSTADENLFLKYNKERTMPVIAIGIWVDDMVIICKDKGEYYNALKAGLQKKYKVEDKGIISEFLGIKVSYSEGTIKLDQASYVTSILKRYSLFETKEAPTPDVKGKKLV